ncbi:MAG: undecaprenyl-diphosphate phosphatase [Xanthomonadales bacterium]|nr:undecaprenyl-diphosphate phosphatase [Xanthomonadales bacterium]
MTLLQIIVLSLIQGLTEFLPVSSSAHLILGSRLLDWPDQGLVFDVATHLGTLLAVLVYFRRDLAQIAAPWLVRGSDDKARKLGLVLVLASVPAIVAGGMLHNLVESSLRDIRVIAFTTIGFGVLLWWADARCAQHKDLGDINLKTGLLIGLAQMLALVPGTSRSGITITAGRALGFDAGSAARFSFLLSIPVIAAAGAYGVARMIANDTPTDWLQFSLGIVLSALAGWACIAAFLALLQRIGLAPFVIYRLMLGFALLWIAF